MEQLIECSEVPERAILVGVGLPGEDAEESMAELARLVDTARVDLIDQVIQYREHPDATYFIGKGKAEEIAGLYESSHASIVIFDVDLSPAQTRNLEEVIKGKVIDRTRLILDIFAMHAHTKEAMLGVELAQLEYQLPRLTRLWTHLSRQVSGAGTRSGGIGTRGPGETQLEIDRRLIRGRMLHLKRALDKIKQNRQLERRNREDMLTIALVGYTNSGKSTLMNALTNENLYTDDKLFSTLDPTTRVMHLSSEHNILLTDTVGFIKRLPHHLIVSFRATLEEVIEAYMLIHLVDVSRPGIQEQILAVEKVLDELGALNKPTLMVFNKIDILEDMTEMKILRHKYPNSIEVSALSGQGLDDLRARLLEIASKDEVEIDVSIPHREGQIVNYIYNHGKVIEREFSDNLIYMRARMDRKFAGKLEKYRLS